MATYLDRATIRNSNNFTDRCTLAVANYAKFTLGSTNVPAAKYAWAGSAIKNPYGVYQQLCNDFVLDSAITALADGTTSADSLTDAQIDSIVQTAINTAGLF